MLTEKEQEVYDFIVRYRDDNGCSPLLREIASSIGIKSKGVVHRYIKSLEKSGLIACHSNKHRGFNIIGHKKIFNINSLGKISAGGPIEAVPDQDILELEHMFSNEKCYALKVQGDSMIEAGINDGDTVVIKKTDDADNGKIVVALIDDHEAMLKRIRKKGKTVALESANKNYETKIFGPDRGKVQDVLVSLYRSF